MLRRNPGSDAGEVIVDKAQGTNFTATRNACKLCAPLGACLAFRGVEGAAPLLHGSQGCSTYIRRYLIGHFREPIDIAATNFSERSAVYGGEEDFRVGLANVITQYAPSVVGVATTCLSETIGEDVGMYLQEFQRRHANESLPAIVTVSTPSYAGTHMEGFHAAVRSIVDGLAEPGPTRNSINLLPGMVSPEDLRHLEEILESFQVEGAIIPNYADTLDGPSWEDYERIPEGGTPVAAIRGAGSAQATIEFGATWNPLDTTGRLLEKRFGVPTHSMGLPIGIAASDRFFETLEDVTGRKTPTRYRKERGRLIDSYVDAHKYVFGKKVVVYGEEDLVVAMTGFLAEIGAQPVLCASGATSGRLRSAIEQTSPEVAASVDIREDADFLDMQSASEKLGPDLIIGHGKGYSMSRKLNVPLLRIGFPVHDRVGAARMLHLGYRGTQRLFDSIVNTLIAARQDADPTAYLTM